ncbi:MAG: LysR family transcriptional regulator [Alphaproteobacteria bacterium]
MELHQIRYFLAVAECLNFTRAAEHCHVAQPSLSRAIKKLEEELGGDLFRRERNRSHMTELGRSMLPILQQCFHSAQAAKELADKYGTTESAPVRIGVSQTVSPDLLVPIFLELERACPGLELRFQRGSGDEILEELRSGNIEVAVTASTNLDWDRLDGWVLFEEGFSLIVSQDHELARQPDLTLAELSSEAFLARPYCENSDQLAAVLRSLGISVRHQHSLSNDEDSLALIESGLGVGILPKSAVRSSTVSTCDVSDLDISRTVNVHAVAGRQRSTAASGLIQLLRAADWPRINEKRAS